MWLMSCRRQGTLTQGRATDPKYKLNISPFIHYTSIFIRLSHFYQQFCYHCIVIMNDGGWDRWGWLIHSRVWVGRQEVGIISLFFFVLLSFGLSYPVSLFSE